VGTVKKSDRPQDRERLPALCDRGGERSARSRGEAEFAQWQFRGHFGDSPRGPSPKFLVYGGLELDGTW